MQPQNLISSSIPIVKGESSQALERTIHFCSNIGGKSFGITRFTKGQGCPIHEHRLANEYNIILSGRGIYFSEEGEFQMVKNDCIFIPYGTKH